MRVKESHIDMLWFLILKLMLLIMRCAQTDTDTVNILSSTTILYNVLHICTWVRRFIVLQTDCLTFSFKDKSTV